MVWECPFADNGTPPSTEDMWTAGVFQRQKTGQDELATSCSMVFGRDCDGGSAGDSYYSGNLAYMV